jgi:hypothetical protein
MPNCQHGECEWPGDTVQVNVGPGERAENRHGENEGETERGNGSRNGYHDPETGSAPPLSHPYLVPRDTLLAEFHPSSRLPSKPRHRQGAILLNMPSCSFCTAYPVNYNRWRCAVRHAGLPVFLKPKRRRGPINSETKTSGPSDGYVRQPTPVMYAEAVNKTRKSGQRTRR